MNNQTQILKIIDKLPFFLCTRWRKQAHNLLKKYDGTTFDDMVKFVADAADEMNDPVYGKNRRSRRGTYPETQVSKEAW